MSIIARGIYRDEESRLYLFTGGRIAAALAAHGIEVEAAAAIVGTLVEQAMTAEAEAYRLEGRPCR